MPENPDIELTESAQRMADAVNLHLSASRALGRETPGFVAVRLSDGRSPDGVLYDTRQDAVNHHRWDNYICFVKVGKTTMPLEEAKIYLKFNRLAHKNGVRFQEEAATPLHLNEFNFGG